jgi:hypothetical protein
MDINSPPWWNKRRSLLAILLAVAVPYGFLMLRFSLRNDQISYFLPVRMYMSDAFRHHEFLFWNPFVAGGYPMHSDMQAPVWNPLVILFSFLFNYNASLLSVELLVYYLIGAFGCWCFARNFARNYLSCTIIAIIYGCGGYGVSILEYMSWVGGFAFLPWALHFFCLVLKTRQVYVAIGLSASLWLMLVCGYPSFLIYLGYVLAALALAYFVQLYTSKRKGEIIDVGKALVQALFLLVLLALPAIRSFFEYLPYYTRGKRALDVHINVEYFSWNYLLSLVFPVSGTLHWDNDIYIGLVPFLVLFSGAIGWMLHNPIGKLHRPMGNLHRPIGKLGSYRNTFLLTGSVFTFLFTLGRSTPVRMWAARHLPLLDSFGFSHSVGIFFILAAFVWLGPQLDLLLSGQLDKRQIMLIRYGAGLAGLILLAWVIAGYHRVVFRTNIIRFFYYGSFLWQLFLLLILTFHVKIYGSIKRLFFFIAADLVISVLTVAPLTGFTLTSPAAYNRTAARFYQSDPKDFLMIPAARTAERYTIDKHTGINAIKIIPRRNFPSNTRSEAFYDYVRDSSRFARLRSLPFVFAADSTALTVHTIELGYNDMHIDVTAKNNCVMVIEQTYHKRWRADRPEYAPGAYEGVFLAVALKKGDNQVGLFYYREDLVIEAIISIITLIILGIILLRRYRTRISLGKISKGKMAE